MGEREDVHKIRQRHDDFEARYSPGPDWEPFNQTHRDRGALLAALDAAEARVAEVARERDDFRAIAEDLGRQRDEMAGRVEEIRFLVREAQPTVCSMLCPSVWKTGTPQPHGWLCLQMSAPAAPPEGQGAQG